MRFPASLFRAVTMSGLILAVAATASAADWAQMGGPNRDMASPETGLARTWPEAGPKILWTVPLGIGYSSPSVRDGEVYILDRQGVEKDVLRCFALESGKELWQCAYDAPGEISHDGTRTAPTVDEKYVYSVGMLGHFYCIDRKSHEPVWHKNLLEDFGTKTPMWGVSQAPSIYKDLVIVAPHAADAYVAAYAKETGELVWKTPAFGVVGYSTPVIVTLAGEDQAVMIGACTKTKSDLGRVVGISLTDGKILWSYDGWQCYIPIPYPTVLPGDRLFITGGYKAGSAMIQVSQENGVFTAKELFKTDVCGSQIQQPLFYNYHLYLNSNSNEREDGMMCLTLDGQVKWQTHDTWEVTTFERGPLLLADGLIYNLDGKKGVLYLVEPSPEGFKTLANVKLLGGKEIWAPMALVDGKLLLRSQEEMKCIDVKNP